MSEISWRTPNKKPRKSEDNIKMNLIVSGCEYGNFFEVAKDSCMDGWLGGWLVFLMGECFVGCLDGRLVGWIDRLVRHLTS
jgi:hypothetical protein